MTVCYKPAGNLDAGDTIIIYTEPGSSHFRCVRYQRVADNGHVVVRSRFGGGDTRVDVTQVFGWPDRVPVLSDADEEGGIV